MMNEFEVAAFCREGQRRQNIADYALSLRLDRERSDVPQVGPLAPANVEGMRVRVAAWVADGYEPLPVPASRRGQTKLF